MRLGVWLALVLWACGGGGKAGPAAPAGHQAPGIEKTTEEGPVKATVTVTHEKPKLGDRLHVTLAVEAQPGVEIVMPPFAEALQALDRFEMVPPYAPARLETGADGKTRGTQEYVLRPRLSGRHRIPAFRIEFSAGDAGVELRELLTSEIPIEVESALPEGAPRELRPLRGALPALSSRSFLARAWPVFGGVLLLAAGGVLAVVALRRRSAEKARISAFDVAMARLSKLEARGLPTPEQADAWYVELSGIIRRYLEDRFAIRAPELTTEEFLREAGRSGGLQATHRELLGTFLATCDQVKFAGKRPAAAESQDALQPARRFLEETRVEGAQP